MMPNITPSLSESSPAASGAGKVVAFGQIDDPGAYVCNWSGHLLRCPEDALKPGRSPALEIVGAEHVYVTKISDNPFIARTKARMIASDLDLPVNF